MNKQKNFMQSPAFLTLVAIVVAFLAVPYLKTTYFKSAKAVPPIVETQAGGDDDA